MSFDERYHPYPYPPMPGPYGAPAASAPQPPMAAPGPAPYPSGAAGYAAHGAYAGGYPYPGQRSSSFLNFGNERFVKGLLIGAAATYLLTNESVQRTAIKGAVKAWTAVQGGMEELKERFQDAEAEIRAAEAGAGPENE